MNIDTGGILQIHMENLNTASPVVSLTEPGSKIKIHFHKN